jgi:hypothetical protein
MPEFIKKMRKKAVARRRRETSAKRYDSRGDLHWFHYTLRRMAKTSADIPFSQIQKFGKPFIGAFNSFEVHSKKSAFEIGLGMASHESPVGVYVKLESPIPSNLGFVKLAFSKGAVLVEAVQGRKGGVRPLKDFSSVVGMPWPNYLIKKIMALARRLGYEEIRFRDPETLHWFKDPAVFVLGKKEKSEAQESIRVRMQKFYANIRTALGLTERRGDYWIKKL